MSNLSAPGVAAFPSRRVAWLLWGLAAIAMGLGLGARAVSRTQEARVLETACEMVQAGGVQWLVPRVNERVRLQKPPLAYWASAIAFKTFGVHEAIGRIPMALAAWLTVGLAYVIARRVFDAPGALLAATLLLGSYLFVRWSRLAETDMLVALFVTSAMWCMWRGFDGCSDGPLFDGGQRSAIRWFHLGGVAMALAWMSKGPAAFYPLIFFLALCAVERRAKPLKLWAASGAWLTFAVLAAPWYLYVRQLPDFQQAKRDLENSALGGRGHGSMFWNYIPMLLLMALPWTPLVVAAAWLAIARWKTEPRLRAMLVWIGAIFLPLCVWRNKQIHYLMPLVPPLMILTGGVVGRALVEGLGRGPAVLIRRIWGILIACATVAAFVVPVAGLKARGHITQLDFMVSVTMLAGAAYAAWSWLRRPALAALIDGAVIASLLMIVVLAIWAPTTGRADPRIAGRAILQRYGDRPLSFFRGDSLTLCFHLNRTVPTILRTNDEALAWLATHPTGVVIDSGDEKHAAPPLPAPFEEQMMFPMEDEVWRVYAAAGS